MNGSAEYVGSIIIRSNSPRELKIKREIYKIGKGIEIKNLEDIIEILKSCKSSNRSYSQEIKIKYDKRKNKILLEEKIYIKSSESGGEQYWHEESTKVYLECQKVKNYCENIMFTLETQYAKKRSLKNLDKTINTALKDMEEDIQALNDIIENLSKIADSYTDKSSNYYSILTRIIENIREILNKDVEIYKSFAQIKAHNGYL